jgi:hypothetical protein
LWNLNLVELLLAHFDCSPLLMWWLGDEQRIAKMFQQEVRLVLLWNTKGVTRLRFQVKCPCGRRKRISRWLTNPKEAILWTWWLNRSNDDAYSVAPYHSNIITQRLASNIYKGWAAERVFEQPAAKRVLFLARAHADAILCGGAGSWWRWRGDCSHCPCPGFSQARRKKHIIIYIHSHTCIPVQGTVCVYSYCRSRLSAVHSGTRYHIA